MIRLSMQSQPALIGLRMTPSVQKIHQEQALMEIQQQHATVEMTSTLPRIEIDQSQCFSESGLKGILELASDNNSDSVAKMYESVGRIVDQGNQLADLGRSAEGAIPNQGYYNAFDQFDNEFNMVTMPRSRPKIEVIEGKLNIEVREGTVKLSPKLKEPEIEYTPGKVEVYMKQMNALEIKVEGSNFDEKI